MKIPARQLTTILMTLGLLIAILVMKRQCAAGTAQIFETVSKIPDGGTHD
jgi:hypothetical protein